MAISDKNVSASTSGGTWHIAADYPDAAPLTNVNGSVTYKWVIDILVINNTMVKVGASQSGTITSGRTISITAPTDL